MRSAVVLLVVALTLCSGSLGAEPVDEALMEEMQDVLDEEHGSGSLNTAEFEALLRMVFDLENHPALLRAYNMNKNKPRAKLVSRMKLLVPEVAESKPNPALASLEERAKNLKTPSKPDPLMTQQEVPKKVPNKEVKKENTVAEEYTQRIIALYKDHNPDKASSVADLLRRSKGKEHSLYVRICNKYKVKAQAEYTGPAASTATMKVFEGGQATPEDLQKVFEEMAKLKPEAQKAAVSQLVGHIKRIPKMKRLLTKNEDEDGTMSQLASMKKSSPAQFEQMMASMEPVQRLMIDVFVQVAVGEDEITNEDRSENTNLDERLAADDAKKGDAGVLPEGVDPHAFKDWMAPKADGGEYNAQDVMGMFSKLGELPASKQKAGIKSMAAAIKAQPHLMKNAMKQLGGEGEQFKQMKQMKKLNPKQYEQVLQQLPASQRTMMEVFVMAFDVDEGFNLPEAKPEL